MDKFEKVKDYVRCPSPYPYTNYRPPPPPPPEPLPAPPPSELKPLEDDDDAAEAEDSLTAPPKLSEKSLHPACPPTSAASTPLSSSTPA